MPQDHPKAARLLPSVLAFCIAVLGSSAAAQSDDPEAQYELARRYSSGVGVPMDKERALKLFTSSAAQGFAKAEYELANHYRGRTGRALDLDMASSYLDRSERHGYVPAPDEPGFVFC